MRRDRDEEELQEQYEAYLKESCDCTKDEDGDGCKCPKFSKWLQWLLDDIAEANAPDHREEYA
jgi:hypothetical protein